MESSSGQPRFVSCPVCRCFTKTNGTFGGAALPVVPIVAPYQQEGLEMKPLNHHVMVAMCLASAVPECGARLEEDGKERAEQPSAQHPCCREGVTRLSADGKALGRGWRWGEDGARLRSRERSAGQLQGA